MAEQAVNSVEFFRNESCGKCVPCRLGSQKLASLGSHLLSGEIEAASGITSYCHWSRKSVRAIGLASICGLGRSVPIPLTTAAAFFEEDVKKHLVGNGAEPRNRGYEKIAMAQSEFVSGLFVRDDDEGLFSRDMNGQLVRLDRPTESDYAKNVTLQIDGLAVTVPLAEPLKDANGNIVVDLRRTNHSALYHDLRCGPAAICRENRRRKEDPDPNPMSSAAHDARSRFVVFVSFRFTGRNAVAGQPSASYFPPVSMRSRREWKFSP